MNTPKIYSWHIRYNWAIPGLVERLTKAQKDIQHLPPCECGCNVGMLDSQEYRCMMCRQLLII